MPRPQTVHNLRRNDSESSPRRLLFVDTETRWQVVECRELHTLRLWAGLKVLRTPGDPAAVSFEPCWGRSAEELLDQVEAWARSGESLGLYTHNLSFDLAVTRLPLGLLGRGWELGQHNLASDAPWARLKRKGKRLRLADSFSWLPVSIQTLGELLGLPKPQLPAEEDSEEAWLARCRADVGILAAAMVQLMDEWDRRKLGHWSLTGSGSGWNALLHMTRRHQLPGRPARDRSHDPELDAPAVSPVVIDPNPRARALEREAIYSGRRDVWRWGELPAEEFCELDFRSAHATICASLPLPDRRNSQFSGLAEDDWRWSNRLVTMVARCRVRTSEPRYPFRWRGQVLHPVGEFETVLAGPELRDARLRGELLEVGDGWSYRVGSFMAAWGRWVLEVLYGSDPPADPMLQVAAKGWSRKVPGRWGMLVNRELRRRPSPNLGWALEEAAFGRPPRRGFLLTLGGEQVELVHDQEAEDSFPAVLAHIQSWGRLLQGRMLELLGEGNVVQTNTDSALVRFSRLEELGAERRLRGAEGDPAAPDYVWGMEEVNAVTRPLLARLKASGVGGRVLSPQHLEFAGVRKFAGVPRGAEELEPGVFRFWTWPKLKGQIERGDPRGYVRELRTVDLRGLTPNRWRYECGCLEPVEARWCPAEGTRLVPARLGACPAHGGALMATQHELLRGL